MIWELKKTIYERMGGTYIRHGDYLIPSLVLPAEKKTRQMGVWGQRHLQYLKEYRKDVYLELLTGGRLNDYLDDIDEQAQERFEGLVEQLKPVSYTHLDVYKRQLHPWGSQIRFDLSASCKAPAGT